ncbi:s-adenosyl-l-methionine:delta24-sterol-C-methyltransferase [Reticulomyxa filosa]|uniref:Methyltransferase n=1 Tax=Reticulomyxa filosa TaxID=46433 RepID=X6N5S5_RETFI|nr:s-adenosyl-l-methionine:delta24-sterol-C-methyltransferase [Reticulomyxa filosa]|eukprot:ETO21356.1 s-adenosyl-l-methionine:delta24-sterol-C-methyltransferase [Reticulomyxa filosa]
MYADRDKGAENRKKNAAAMVDTFYDLVTDFYENGWGQSFHFAPRGRFETFRESIVRHEHYIAAKLDLNENDYVLDVGCGIGGPMRNIAQFSSAKICGITINEFCFNNRILTIKKRYQVKRGTEITRKAGLEKLCESRVMNFLDMKFNDNTFDKAFAVEATCHAGNREDVFSQVFRVLKPGGLFASYEWVLTDKYDDENSKHKKARQQVEKGNALPQIITANRAVEAFKNVGFGKQKKFKKKVLSAVDVHKYATDNGQLPWYGTLEAKCSVENLPQSYIATVVTHTLCSVMEKIGMAPKGTTRAHEILLEGRDGLVASGQLGIFTPMFLIIGRKPSKKT